jgi:hypothetical protein
MRIIKSDIDTIIGEMLNIETSTLSYLDGKPAAEQYIGYPRINDNHVTYHIKAVIGFIFVPTGVNISELILTIISRIKVYEALHYSICNVNNSKTTQILHDYHTVRASTHTNVKVFTQSTLTKSVIHKVNNHVKRCIVEYNDDIIVNDIRFVWYITPLSDFDIVGYGNDTAIIIQKNICSIFYDCYNICNLPHNSIINEYTTNILKGSSNFITQDLYLNIALNIQSIEFNNYWKSYAKIYKRLDLVDIPKNKISKHDYKGLTISPVKYEKTLLYDYCSKCKQILFGTNYVFVGKDTPSIALCPICTYHNSPEEHVHNRYSNIYEVEFPRSANDIIHYDNPSSDSIILRKAVLEGITMEVVTVNGQYIEYINIGSNMIGIKNKDIYLYTGMCNLSEISNKYVCVVHYI